MHWPLISIQHTMADRGAYRTGKRCIRSSSVSKIHSPAALSAHGVRQAGPESQTMDVAGSFCFGRKDRSASTSCLSKVCISRRLSRDPQGPVKIGRKRLRALITSTLRGFGPRLSSCPSATRPDRHSPSETKPKDSGRQGVFDNCQRMNIAG